jgi:hypothetical protein
VAELYVWWAVAMPDISRKWQVGGDIINQHAGRSSEGTRRV